MLRKKAIALLQNCENASYTVCLVGGIPVSFKEKNLLLDQLMRSEDYLHIPLSLYEGDAFWKKLKDESETECRIKNIDIDKRKKEVEQFLSNRKEANMLVLKDNSGENASFEIVDVIVYQNEEYAFLLIEGGKWDEDGLLVTKAVCENGVKTYIAVWEEDKIDDLFDIFFARNWQPNSL